MSQLVWNCRGAGNRRTVREVLALVNANVPKLVFLSETRQDVVRMEKLKWRLGLKGFHGVSSDGRSGGLALFWDEALTVTVLDSCSCYIDVHFDDVGGGTSWSGSFVYGEPRVEDRHLMWTIMQNLKQVSELPWLIVGDFNKALWGF